MRTFVGFLRGINVGGRNKLPMAELREICASVGLNDIQTYIQSGNLVFKTDDEPSLISEKVGREIEARFGFRPSLVIVSADELRNAADRFPFPVENHKLATIMFLESEPDADAVAALNKINHEPDLIEVGKGVVNIYFPNGVAGAKTNLAKIERVLGVGGTARNWRTVQKMLGMIS